MTNKAFAEKQSRSFQSFIENFFEHHSDRANQRIGTTPGERQSWVVESDKGYKCIHLSVNEFINAMRLLVVKEFKPRRDHNPYTFLDVGCGVGQKVTIAKALFDFDAYGLELRDQLYRVARQLHKDLFVRRWHQPTRKSQFFKANALTFPRYDQFDLIYFYCPIADHVLQTELEKKILTDAKVGAVILGYLAQYIPGEYGGHPDVMEHITSLGWEHRVMGPGHRRSYLKRISKP